MGSVEIDLKPSSLSWPKKLWQWAFGPSVYDRLADLEAKQEINRVALTIYMGMVTKALARINEIEEWKPLFLEEYAEQVRRVNILTIALEAFENIRNKPHDVATHLIAQLDQAVSDVNERCGRTHEKLVKIEEDYEVAQTALADLTRMLRNDLQQLGLDSETYQEQIASLQAQAKSSVDRHDRQAKMLKEAETRMITLSGTFQYLEKKINGLKRPATKSKRVSRKRS